MRGISVCVCERVPFSWSHRIDTDVKYCIHDINKCIDCMNVYTYRINNNANVQAVATTTTTQHGIHQ